MCRYYIVIFVLLMVSCINKQQKSENNQKIKILNYSLDHSIQSYSNEEYKKSLLIADSLLKENTISCKECIMVVLNQIKLRSYKKAEKSITFCKKHHDSFDTNGCMKLFELLESTLEYSIEYRDEEQLNIVTNLVFNLKDSMDIIDKYFNQDISNTYTITVED